jgi:predicted nucleic acid-binding protein
MPNPLPWTQRHSSISLKKIPHTSTSLNLCFQEISRGNIRAFTSQITLIEVLIKPLEEKNDDLIIKYRDILSDSDNLFLSDVDKEIAMEAARLRAVHKLKVPDAIQLATGLINGADAFITNDDSFKTVKGRIEVIVLHELT